MKITVTGSSGLIGSALLARLRADRHDVVRLVRSPTDDADSVRWDPGRGSIESDAFEDADCVVHLGGASIATRWTVQNKRRIMESRVNGTRFLSRALAEAKSPPRTLIMASAIGYYGDRADEMLDEASDRGDGFLSDVVEAWEEAAQPARDAGIRVVKMRFGIVLSRAGGALRKMLPPFLVGAGGPIGSGNQYMSWITLDDAVSSILFAIEQDALEGPVNIVTPSPVTNREFSKALGKALHRPSLLPLPAAVVRLLMGEMGDELLLASTRVMPGKLTAAGFDFEYPHLEEGLKHVLEREQST